jgi:hypothetical protein
MGDFSNKLSNVSSHVSIKYVWIVQYMGDFSTKTWEDTLAGKTRRERSKITLGNSRKTSKKEKKKNGVSWKG